MRFHWFAVGSCRHLWGSIFRDGGMACGCFPSMVGAIDGAQDAPYDLLGDGSLLAVAMPGHARVQAGLLVVDQRGLPVTLCGDAVWRSSPVGAGWTGRPALVPQTHEGSHRSARVLNSSGAHPA